MCEEFDVVQTPFDLDVFQQILEAEAMDGYYVLPTIRYTGELRQTIDPWDLPNMPDIGADAWKYHVGFAVDRGFVEC